MCKNHTAYLHECLTEFMKSKHITDEKSLQNLILWLEDQKIRNYKIDDRKFLQIQDHTQWKKSFKKYLDDLKCPIPASDLPGAVDWLLGLAVQFEYSDDG